MPCAPEKVTEVARLVGPVQPQIYGEAWDVVAQEGAINIARPDLETLLDLGAPAQDIWMGAAVNSLGANSDVAELARAVLRRRQTTTLSRPAAPGLCSAEILSSVQNN